MAGWNWSGGGLVLASEMITHKCALYNNRGASLRIHQFMCIIIWMVVTGQNSDRPKPTNIFRDPSSQIATNNERPTQQNVYGRSWLLNRIHKTKNKTKIVRSGEKLVTRSWIRANRDDGVLVVYHRTRAQIDVFAVLVQNVCECGVWSFDYGDCCPRRDPKPKRIARKWVPGTDARSSASQLSLLSSSARCSAYRSLLSGFELVGNFDHERHFVCNIHVLVNPLYGTWFNVLQWVGTTCMHDCTLTLFDIRHSTHVGAAFVVTHVSICGGCSTSLCTRAQAAK